jgi:hypothetical protein
MKIATNSIGELFIELSDGMVFKITEHDGFYLADGVRHPRHYLNVSTLRDKDSGERPGLWSNNHLTNFYSIALSYDPFDEGYEQGEY